MCKENPPLGVSESRHIVKVETLLEKPFRNLSTELTFSVLASARSI